MSSWSPRGGGASLPEGPVLTPADDRSPARPLANDWAVVAFTLCGPLAAVLAARLAVGRLPITANLRRRMGFEIDAVAIVALVAVTVSAVIVARDPGLLPGQRTGIPAAVGLTVSRALGCLWYLARRAPLMRAYRTHGYWGGTELAGAVVIPVVPILVFLATDAALFMGIGRAVALLFGVPS